MREGYDRLSGDSEGGRTRWPATPAVNIGAFDFAARPGGLVYVLAYVLVMLDSLFIVTRFGPFNLGMPEADGAPSTVG